MTKVIFQDFPGPGFFKKKIYDFPGLSRRRGNPAKLIGRLCLKVPCCIVYGANFWYKFLELVSPMLLLLDITLSADVHVFMQHAL